VFIERCCISKPWKAPLFRVTAADFTHSLILSGTNNEPELPNGEMLFHKFAIKGTLQYHQKFRTDILGVFLLYTTVKTKSADNTLVRNVPCHACRAVQMCSVHKCAVHQNKLHTKETKYWKFCNFGHGKSIFPA
jgi:hypothetical protein